MHELAEICSNMCIICFAKTTKGEFKNVFNKEDPSKGLSHLGNIYEELFQLSIIPDDKYPQYFCNYCAFQIKLFHKFRIKAIEAYNNMMKVVQVKREDNQQPSTNLKLKELEISFDLNKFHSENLTIVEDDENCGDFEESINKFLDNEVVTIGSKKSKVYDDEDEEEILIESVFLVDDGDNRFQDSDKEEGLINSKNHTNKISEAGLIRFSADKTSNDIDKTGKGMKYECNICDEKFSTVIKLKRHKLSFHSTLNEGTSSTYTCNKCEIVFTTKRYLDLHRKEKHPRTFYNCTLCPKKCYSEETLQVHMNLHNGLPAYKCEECGKEFKKKPHHVYHMLGHRNERNAQCHLCGKGFLTNSDLRIHLRAHTDERRYECDICGRRFRVRTHMTDHRYSHFGKQLECPICSHKFNSPRNLRTHIKEGHKGERSFECEFCHKKFKRKHHLKVHYKTHQRNFGNTC